MTLQGTRSAQRDTLPCMQLTVSSLIPLTRFTTIQASSRFKLKLSILNSNKEIRTALAHRVTIASSRWHLFNKSITTAISRVIQELTIPKGLQDLRGSLLLKIRSPCKAKGNTGWSSSTHSPTKTTSSPLHCSLMDTIGRTRYLQDN